MTARGFLLLCFGRGSRRLARCAGLCGCVCAVCACQGILQDQHHCGGWFAEHSAGGYLAALGRLRVVVDDVDADTAEDAKLVEPHSAAHEAQQQIDALGYLRSGSHAGLGLYSRRYWLYRRRG